MQGHTCGGESSGCLGRCFPRPKGNPVSQGQEVSKAKRRVGIHHGITSSVQLEKPWFAGHLRFKKQKLILVGHGELMTMYNNVAPVLVSQQRKQKLWRNVVYWLALLDAHPDFSHTPGPPAQQCAAFTSVIDQKIPYSPACSPTCWKHFLC